MSDAQDVLPRNVVPTHYHLSLLPDLEQSIFSAEVTIDVVIKEPTSAIVLNAVDLHYTNVSVQLRGSSATEAESVEVLGVHESAEDQRVTLRLSRPVDTAAQLEFHYTAAISDTLFGFYRSAYTYNGEKRWVGATQLCPAEARRVFPCWDEPSVKATFALDLTLPEKLQAWSNAPASRTVALSNGLVRWEFRPLYAMSTYLLAWVVGEMETSERMVQHAAVAAANGVAADEPSASADSYQLRAVVPCGKARQADFALKIAAQVLPIYEEYFQCRYVFPKMDLVALPNFAFGAMENWGCVTFREQTLLVTPESSTPHKESVAIVVAHELAHQWFGNLATMAWWSDLWLNESFATYIATWVLNKLYPDWTADTQFVFTEGSRAFQLDALRSSHPIEIPVRDVREVDGIFDAISYAKGAMILRMTAKFIGEEGFQKGLTDYLSRYAFAAATSEQLWACLSGPAAPNLKDVLQSWTRVQGYPYLAASHDRATGTLTLTQHRFLAQNDATAAEDEALWQIPMYYTYRNAETGDLTTEPLVMRDRTVTVSVKGADWVKVNSDLIAFCRVQYSAEMLQSLVRAVEDKAIGGTDRYSLIADAAALARGGYAVDTAQALALLAHYSAEDTSAVWSEIVEFELQLRCIVASCNSADVSAAFNAYCQRLYKPALTRLGLTATPGEDFRAEQMRVLLFGRLLACQDAETTAAARAMYEQRQTTSIPVGMTAAVCGVRVREGGQAALDEMMALAAACNDAELRAHYLGALAAVLDPETGVKAVVHFLLSDAVPSQDVLNVLRNFARRADAQHWFVQELIAQWPQLSRKMPTVMLARLVKQVEYCCDAALATQLREFLAGLPVEMQSRIRMTLNQGVETLLCNAAWATRDRQCIAEYLLKA